MEKKGFKDQTLQDVVTKSADGTSVFGCLQKSSGEGPFPAVIFIHGGLGDS